MGVQAGCARCRQRETPLFRCPYCGTTAAELELARNDVTYEGIAEDAALERKLRLWAVPVMMLVALLCMRSHALRALSRTFLSMWLHEIGHAVTAWMCGHTAFPGPWRTSFSDHRTLLAPVLVLGLTGFVGYRARAAGRRRIVYTCAGIGALAVAGYAFLTPAAAQMLFTFGGDAGMMLLGAALVTTFFAPVGSHLHTSWLRWGLAVIGAFSVADGVTTWWTARSDPSVIPYGEIEGVGLSDPSKLVDVHGWTQSALVGRYTAVAVVAIGMIIAAWARDRWRSRSKPAVTPGSPSP